MPRLRIHFTDIDVGRTRVKMGIDPMWEVVSSVQLLQHRGGGVFFDRWRRVVREQAVRDHPLRAAIHTLTTVAPHTAYFPDFLTPALDGPDFDTGVEAVLSTPTEQLRTEIDLLRKSSDSFPWLERLKDGRGDALRQLGTALNTYVKHVIDPHRQVIDTALRTDGVNRAQAHLHHGTEGLLTSLEPIMTWTPPILAADYPVDRDLHLRGRGLLLIPSYFCLDHPVALADPQLPPVLVFPVTHAARLTAANHTNEGHLEALLGPTRAALLRSVLDNTTNTSTRLAKANNISLATVSHHTTVLRNAGLITTQRDANRAIHHITPLGLHLTAQN